MKKTFLIIGAVLAPLLLTSCGTPKPKTTDDISKDTRNSVQTENVAPEGRENEARILPKIGVRRGFFGSPIGNYELEYYHVPYGMPKDDSLSYELTLNEDNTYTLNVVYKDVPSKHSGRWYIQNGSSITLFYDEKIEDTAHNEYLSDSQYLDMLPGGKLMVYDCDGVIVLSRTDGLPDGASFYFIGSSPAR